MATSNNNGCFVSLTGVYNQKQRIQDKEYNIVAMATDINMKRMNHSEVNKETGTGGIK